MLDGPFCPQGLDEPACQLRVVWLSLFLSLFRSYFREKLYANCVDPDQMPLFAASDLTLRCLPMSFLRGTSYNGANLVSKGIPREIINP